MKAIMDPQRKAGSRRLRTDIGKSERFVTRSQPAGNIQPRRPRASMAKADKHPERLLLPSGRRILTPVCTGGKNIPIFAIPSLSLAPADYVTLAALLDEQQPFFVFQYPYWEKNANGNAIIQEIAACFATVLNDTQPQGPVAICGWSIGTIVALELAQQLRAAGRDVALLIAIDWAPENTGIQSKNQRFLNSTCSWVYEKWITCESLFSFAQILYKRLTHLLGFELFPKRTQGDMLPKMVSDIYTIPGLNRPQKDFILRLYDGACDYVPKPYAGTVLLFVASYSLHRRDEEKWVTLAPNAESVRLRGTHASIVRWGDAGDLVDHLFRYMTKVSKRAGNFQRQTPTPKKTREVYTIKRG